MEAEELESPIFKLKAGMDSVEVERDRRGKSVQRDPTGKDMGEKDGWVIGEIDDIGRYWSIQPLKLQLSK